MILLSHSPTNEKIIDLSLKNDSVALNVFSKATENQLNELLSPIGL